MGCGATTPLIMDHHLRMGGKPTEDADSTLSRKVNSAKRTGVLTLKGGIGGKTRGRFAAANPGADSIPPAPGESLASRRLSAAGGPKQNSSRGGSSSSSSRTATPATPATPASSNVAPTESLPPGVAPADDTGRAIGATDAGTSGDGDGKDGKEGTAITGPDDNDDDERRRRRHKKKAKRKKKKKKKKRRKRKKKKEKERRRSQVEQQTVLGRHEDYMVDSNNNSGGNSSSSSSSSSNSGSSDGHSSDSPVQALPAPPPDPRLRELPKTVYTVANLRTLDVSENLLGFIGDDISLLASLRTLHAQSNRIARLPSSLGDCAALQTLCLQDNVIGPDIAALPRHLRHLTLSRNRLRVFPTGLITAPCSRLETLDLADNQIQILPFTMGFLRSLKTLDLDGNRLYRLDASIGDMGSLSSLSLRRNALTAAEGSIPRAVWMNAGNALVVIELEGNPGLTRRALLDMDGVELFLEVCVH